MPAGLPSPPERKETDPAAGQSADREIPITPTEGRQFKKQVAELQAESRQAALPAIQFPSMPLTIAPGQPGILNLPQNVELPPVVLPPSGGDLPNLPWNYNTGLYVFPGLDVPAWHPKANNEPPQSPATRDHLR